MAFIHHIGVLFIFFILLTSAEAYSQSSEKHGLLATSLRSQSRGLRIIPGRQGAEKGTVEQKSVVNHIKLRSSKRLPHPEGRGPLSKNGKEPSEETDGDGKLKSGGAEEVGIKNRVQTHQVNNERDANDHKESSNTRFELDEEKQRRNLMMKITALLRRHHDLAITRESLQNLDLKAGDKYHEALRRRNGLSQSWENAHRARLRVERDLNFFQTHSVLQDETLRQLESQTKDANSFIEKLKKKYTNMLKDKAQLAENFREHGLEHWVENSVKGTMNPIVLDAIMQGTGYVVEPVLDGIEKLATINNEVASVVSRGLKRQTSLTNYPFYSGFVSYTVFLCPLVIALSLLTRIRKGISRLSRTNWIILGTFYFFMITGGCLVAMMLGSVDVLQTFRLQNAHVFNSVLVMHGFTYFFYVMLHIYNVIQVRGQGAVSHFLVVTTIGVHFLVRSQRQSLRAEGLEVDVWTYIVYTAVLSFVLYETVFKRESASCSFPKGKARETSRETVHQFRPPSASNISAVHASGD